MNHVLHITNDFGGTEVYRNLYMHLDDLGVKQTIFVPLNPRVLYRKGQHDFKFKTEGSCIIYSVVQKWYHRYLYKLKINDVVRDVKKLVNLQDITLIHAGTLCMTGAVAFELSKRLKKPYIVAIRNTDINAYFKKMWWHKPYFNKVLKSAANIVFISPQYKKDCFSRHFDIKTVNEISNRVKVIPNGVDPYFIKNRNLSQRSLHRPIEIVYAAGFRENKNLLRVISAIDILREKGFDLNLKALGRSLPNRKVTDEYMDKLNVAADGKSYIQLLDYKTKEGLCEFYKDSDIFVMPSINETFGLSYVESLTQGLPIIYTKGQGFDGFYQEGVAGYSVNALDSEDIAKGIELAINNYPTLVKNIVNLPLEGSFNWEEIANIYLNIYNSVTRPS